MSVDDFIAAQERLISEGNFDEYLPTVWVETSRQVKVNILMHPPEGFALVTAAREWAQQQARRHDYCLAFKADESHLKVVARVGAATSEHIVAIVAA